jgi:hypothetical protein
MREKNHFLIQVIRRSFTTKTLSALRNTESALSET